MKTAQGIIASSASGGGKPMTPNAAQQFPQKQFGDTSYVTTDHRHHQHHQSLVTVFQPPSGDQHRQKPPRVLTTMMLVCMVYTTSISGGYGLEDAVRAGGPLLTILFLCLIPFVWGFPVTYIVAELSCAIPSNAGPLMWVNVAFPQYATLTLMVWMLLLIVVDNSLYPTLFTDFAAKSMNLSAMAQVFTKLVFLVLCAVFNVIGVHVVAGISVFVMLATVTPFIILLVLQLSQGGGIDWHRVSYVPPSVNWGLMLPVVAWSFSGFDSAGNLVEEIVKPQKTLVRALLLMILLALATYIPPVLVGCSVPSLRTTPWSEWTDGYWVVVGHAVGGRAMSVVVLVGSSVSCFGLMTTLLATTSRALAGMGSLGAFPPRVSSFFARYHPTYGTPVNAIIVNSVATGILSLVSSFETLVVVDQLLYALRLLMIVLAFAQLRISAPNLVRPYVAPGGTIGVFFWTLAPLLFSSFLIASIVASREASVLSAVGILAVTPVASYAWVRLTNKKGFDGSLGTEEKIDL